MFANHQKRIAAFALQSPDHTREVILFVSSTIQQRFYTVPTVFNSMKSEGIESKYAWGSKADTITYATKHKAELYKTIHDKTMPLAVKLLNVAAIDGIGLPKAGFILQLCIGEAGCLDVHNLKRFGLSPNTFKLPKKLGYDTALRKAELYLKTLEDLGGCEYLWDSWCNFIADLYPKRYDDGEHVSRCHVTYLMGDLNNETV